MIKKYPQINHVEETENVKWCVFKVPQCIYKRLANALIRLRECVGKTEPCWSHIPHC